MEGKHRYVDAAIIEQRIRELRSLEQEGRYREFWKKCKDMGTFFKYSELTRTDRERLWEDYDALCKKVKGKRESLERGAEDARRGQIDLRRATDSEYRSAYDKEETKQFPNLFDVTYGRDELLKWYHRCPDDRKAEHELDKSYRRAEEERGLLDELRRKRQKEINRLLREEAKIAAQRERRLSRESPRGRRLDTPLPVWVRYAVKLADALGKAVSALLSRRQ